MSKPLDGTGQKRLHRDWRRRTDGRLALLLDSVQTPFNVGAILRTAAAFRVEHLWLCGATESPTHPKTRKTALGTDRYLTWADVESPAEAADEARAAGFTVVGIELATDARPLFEVDCTGPVCLALGHEERGLSAAALAACDAIAYIPMLGKVGSLNVAAAAAIACYEVRRQEWTDASPPARNAGDGIGGIGGNDDDGNDDDDDVNNGNDDVNNGNDDVNDDGS